MQGLGEEEAGVTANGHMALGWCKCFGTRHRWWLHNVVNVLNATAWYTKAVNSMLHESHLNRKNPNQLTCPNREVYHLHPVAALHPPHVQVKPLTFLGGHRAILSGRWAVRALGGQQHLGCVPVQLPGAPGPGGGCFPGASEPLQPMPFREN